MELLLALIHYRYDRWGDPVWAERCLLGILEMTEYNTSREMRASVEGGAWMELLALAEEYAGPAKLREYVERALDCFAQADRLSGLARVHFVKARLLWRIRGEAGTEEEQVQLCREECRMAWYLFRTLGLGQEQREVERYCEEEMRWHITTRTK